MKGYLPNVRKHLRALFHLRYLFANKRILLFVIIGFWTIYIILSGFISKRKTHEAVERELINELEYESGCNFPKMNPFLEDILRYEFAPTPITCSGQDWVRCTMSECRVISPVLNRIKGIKCLYTDILYINDYNKYYLSNEKSVMGSEPYVLNKSDYVIVKCRGNENGSIKRWSGLALGFRNVEPKSYIPKMKNSPNILLLMFESLSKGGFIRRMPKSHKLLTEKLKAVIMNGHNVVGDGTGVQVIGMLTGKRDLEEPDIFISFLNLRKKYVDDLPLIFYKLKDYGYRTAYFENSPDIGTFTYRYNGFKKQPTDHYLFPFVNVVNDNRYNTPPLDLKYKNDIERKYCVGDTPEYALMLNTTRQFFNLDSNKFCFNFIVNTSHDSFSMISNIDDKLVEFLTEFEESGHLKNTLLFVMGDHGSRFGKIRSTIYGKLEERRPLVAIILPSDLKRRRPDAEENLKRNSDVLTSHYDIHATILDAVGLEEFTNPYSVPGSNIRRSLSLLQPIPRSRSCAQAGIERQWCSCIKWIHVSSSDQIYVKSAIAVVDFINNLTLIYRNKCAVRKLAQIDWVMRQQPMLLKGQTPNATSKYIQVRAIIDPAKAEYEVTLRYDEDMGFTINSNEISRTDKYGDQPHCISNIEPKLNQYCYCNDLLIQ